MRKLAWQCLAIVGLLLAACRSDQVMPVPVTPPSGPATVPLATLSINLSTPAANPQHGAGGAPLPTVPVVPSGAPVAWTPMPAGSTARILHGDLANQVARLETGMPGAGSGGFAVPTNPEKEAFGALAAELVAGQLGQTAEVYGYQITRYADRGDAGAERLMLREREPVQRAWGLYLFRIGQASNVIVEAPHPLSDEATPIIATSAYRALKARALLIAGARRDTNRDGSADVAHNARTVFQVMHQALVASGELVVLQFHGFSAARHDGYPQVVLSSPEPGAERLLDHMAGALRDKGLSVGVCNSGNLSELCGGTNAQALAVEDDTLIHIELDQSVREDAGALIVALERILGQ